MRNSLIFQVGMKVLFPLLILGSLIIFWRGHQLPGGGFIGGLVAGAALGTHAFCYGVNATLRMMRIQPLSFVMWGLFFAILSGVLGLFFGAEPFTGLWVSVPLIGSLGTPVLFDLGVYLLVIGFVAVFITQTLKGDS